MGVFPFPMPFSGPPKFGSFSPLALFAASEPGGWYDPSDLTTLFQDAAGTTPVTAVEQPVGLVLDKSKGLTLGSELVTNGDFSSATGWTQGAGWSISGGVATATATNGYLYQVVASVAAGKYYDCTVTITSYTSGTLRFFAGAAAALSTGMTASGTYTLRVCANSASQLGVVGTAFTGIIDNISIKEVTGNHLSQSTSTARPVLSARVNLLTRTEEFDNAAWTKSGATIAANATTAPDSTSTADKLVEAGASGSHQVYSGVFTTVIGSVTYSVRVKAAGRSWVFLADNTGGVYFNVGNGTVGTASGGRTGTITADANGFYVCSVTGSWSGTQQIYIVLATGDGTTSYTGDGTSGIYLWGADLRPSNAGVGLPAYQRVGAATDYDTTGFPLYLKFDGTDDFLVSGTISPGSVDKAQVFAGVRKLSDAGISIVAEYGPIVDTTAGTFALGNSIGGTQRWFSALRGNTALVYYEPATYAAPITSVFSSLFDIAGSGIATEILPRVNGTLTQTNGNGSASGAGSFSSQPLYVGQRGSIASLRFNGHLYSLILRFSATNLDAATIASTETWVNNRTKAY